MDAPARLPDPPLVPALPPDVRYRDMCIAGANIPSTKFDPDTGKLLADDVEVYDTVERGGGGGAYCTYDYYYGEYCEYYYEYYYDAYYEDYYYGYLPDSVSQFDQIYVGKVAGAKPINGACMPMKDTATVNVSEYATDPNLAFTYFMNLADRPFTEGADNPNQYQRSNASQAKSFFIEGVLACPDLIDYKKNTPGKPWYDPTIPNNQILAFWDYANRRPFNPRETIKVRADYMRYKADFCYNYYILGHGIAPWYTLERPGISTDDPLTYFDPYRAYLNSCQPMIRGSSTYTPPNPPSPAPPIGSPQREQMWSDWRANPVNGNQLAAVPGAREVQWGAWHNKKFTSLMEKQAGFAPVYQYLGRADWDEAEYFLSRYLETTWNDVFSRVGDAISSDPNFVVKDKVGARPTHEVYPNPFSGTTVGLPCVQRPGFPVPITTRFPDINFSPDPPPGGQCSSDSPPDSPPDRCGIPWQPMPRDYAQPSYSSNTYYCPNIEKITEPSHPFSPRNDMSGMTDRDYSSRTSRVLPYPRVCDSDCRLGYTDYNVRNPGQTPIDARCSRQVSPRYQDMDRYRRAMPVVQCGVVPVDILSFRERAFNNCITQRINWNFNMWVLQGFPPPASYDPEGNNVGGFNPPCKTRYWEHDNGGFGGCPVRMSIQQCCRIISKDVVPANFLKLRTCEGVLQKRRDDDDLQKPWYLNGTTSGANPDRRTHITLAPFEDKLLGMKSRPLAASGSPIGIDNVTVKHITVKLNEKTCDDKEPVQYRFDKYSKFKKFNNVEVIDPPPGTDCGQPNPNHLCDHGKYLGVHMPYMRWWDTGVSAGNAHHGGSPINTLGSFDTLVGVGREGRDLEAAKKTKERYEEMEAPADMLTRVQSTAPSQVGRFGGWSEIKAHQMWSIRRNNLYCIGRYEKMFKPGGPENFVLAKAGAGYSSRVGEQWPWSLGWRGYITDTSTSSPPKSFPHFGMPGGGSAPFGHIPARIGLDNVLPGDIIVHYPKRYPRNLIAVPNPVPTYYGVPQIYYVTDIGGYANDRDELIPEGTRTYFDYNIGKYRIGPYNGGGQIVHPTRAFVVAWDQGKFPTSTGMSIHWGMGPERTIYKTAVPKNYAAVICEKDIRALTDFNDYNTPKDQQEYYCRDNVAKKELDRGMCISRVCQPSCNDIDYSACVLPNGAIDWNTTMIYRPTDDVRPCMAAQPGVAFPPINGITFNTADTYAWKSMWDRDPITGDVKLRFPQDTVIYQAKTQLIPTNFWSWCVNKGYDPPHHYAADYKGAQTGAITDTTLCAPLPHGRGNPGSLTRDSGCSTRPGEKYFFFPEGSPLGR